MHKNIGKEMSEKNRKFYLSKNYSDRLEGLHFNVEVCFDLDDVQFGLRNVQIDE